MNEQYKAIRLLPRKIIKISDAFCAKFLARYTHIESAIQSVLQTFAALKFFLCANEKYKAY